MRTTHIPEGTKLLTHITTAFIVLVGILDTLPVKLVLTRLCTLQDILSVGATNVGAVENNVLHAIGCATSSVPHARPYRQKQTANQTPNRPLPNLSRRPELPLLLSCSCVSLWCGRSGNVRFNSREMFCMSPGITVTSKCSEP